MSDIVVLFVPKVTTPLLLSTVVPIPVIMLHDPDGTVTLIVSKISPEQPLVSLAVIVGIGFTVTLTVSAHPFAV